MKSDIAFTDTILKKVSKDLDIDYNKVYNVYTSVVKYIYYLAHKTDAVAIFIPHLGTLYIKMKHVKHKFSTYSSYPIKNKDKIIVYRNKYKKILKYVREYVEDDKYHTESRHLEKPKIENRFYTDNKTIEEIEKFQNKL